MTGDWPALFASVHVDLALDVSVPRRLNAFVAVVFFSALREGTDGFLSALRAMVVAVPLSAAKVAEHSLVASQTKYTPPQAGQVSSKTRPSCSAMPLAASATLRHSVKRQSAVL